MHVIISLIKFLWRVLDTLIKVLLTVSILLSLYIVFVLLTDDFSSDSWDGEDNEILPNSLLVLEPVGVITDVPLRDINLLPFEELFLAGDGRQVPLRKIQYILEQAATDSRITAVQFDLSGVLGISLPTAMELAKNITTFKESGKPFIATGQVLGHATLLLTAAADKTVLEELGFVFIRGFARSRLFMADLFENIKVKPHVYTAGDYKSAPEVFTRNDMSDEERAQTRVWIQPLWESWKESVAQMRGISPQALQSYVENFTGELIEAEGYISAVAYKLGLIDYFGQYDDGKVRVIDGEDVDAVFNILTNENTVSHHAYYADINPPYYGLEETPGVGVIYVNGELVSSSDATTNNVAEIFAENIYDMAENENVQAILVRVNSPGGSVYASEVMRRAIESVRDKGTPVVVSFGSVGASGAYWLATAADKIVAADWTLTGSIGVFSMRLDFSEATNWMGVYEDGYYSAPRNWSTSAIRPPTAEDHQISEVTTHFFYQRFLDLVAANRNIPVKDLTKSAGGRVWLGNQALELGLIDAVADFEESLAITAELGGLDTDDLRVIELSPELNYERFFERFAIIKDSTLTKLANSVFKGVPNGDPTGSYALCLECRTLYPAGEIQAGEAAHLGQLAQGFLSR